MAKPSELGHCAAFICKWNSPRVKSVEVPVAVCDQMIVLPGPSADFTLVVHEVTLPVVAAKPRDFHGVFVAAARQADHQV